MATQGPTQRVNHLVRIPQITVTTGLALAGGVVALTAAFFFTPKQYQDLLLFFIRGGLHNVRSRLAYAALYAARILQLTANAQTAADEFQRSLHEMNIQNRLIDKSEAFCARWNDATLFHVRQHCQALIDNRTEPDKIRQMIAGDPGTYANVRHILNFLEEIALSVNKGNCDASIVREAFGGIVVNVWHAAEFFVKEHRSARSRPKIWENLEKLYGDWK